MNEIERTIKDAIDDTSIAEVLEIVAEVCRRKADHIMSNWQDHELAVQWTNLARRLESLANGPLG